MTTRVTNLNAMLSVAAVLVITSVAHAQDSQAGEYSYEHSDNDGVGYEQVAVNGHYRNFAPIHEAAKRGDVATIRQELAEGVPADLLVANRGGNGWWKDTTPLMWAAMRGTAEAVKVLIEAGADVNASSSDGVTASMFAAGAVPTTDGDASLRLKALVAAGANLEARDRRGLTALGWACGLGSMIEDPATDRIPAQWKPLKFDSLIRPDVHGTIGLRSPFPASDYKARYGDLERVLFLIESGSDVNAEDGRYNLLSSIAHSGNVDRARALLNAGAVVQDEGPGQWSPITIAAAYGTAEMVRLFIQAGADPNAIDRINCNQTTLIWAARSGEQSGEKVRALLAAGADIRIHADNNFSPLMACFTLSGFHSGEAVPALIEAGADPFERSPAGDSSLLLAADLCVSEAVELLLQFGFDIEERSPREGRPTALVLAAGSETDAARKVRALLKAGANVEAESDTGRTPLLAAAARGNMEAVEVLVHAGANVNVMDRAPVTFEGGAGMTPLMYVAARGADHIFMSKETGSAAALSLLKAGASVNVKDAQGWTALDHALAIDHSEVVKVLVEAGAIEGERPVPSEP